MTATLETIHKTMKRYNNAAAYGSECNAWQDFVADCYDRFGFAPWADAHWDDVMPEDFSAYWTSVAAGECPDYDADTGRRLDA